MGLAGAAWVGCVIGASACGQSAASGGGMDGAAPLDATGAGDSTPPGQDGEPGDAGSGLQGDAALDAGGAAACAAVAQARCNQYLTCLPTAFHLGWYDSLASCLDGEARACARELGSPGTSMTAMKMAVCAQALASQTCAQFETAVPPECIPPGALGQDAGCQFSSQCQSTLCDIGQGWCGVCSPRLGVGGTCIHRGDLRFSTCEAGLVCASGRCATPLPEGGTCTPRADQCAPPLVCLGGSCAPAVPLGGTCYNFGDCVGDAYCANGNTGGGRCTAITYAPVGGGCNMSIVPLCAAGTNCMDDAGYAVVGTCVAASPQGHACKYNSDCLPTLKCIGGTCQDAPPSCP